MQLLEELPGILNWSLEGLARLNCNDGRFTRVPSAEEAIITMRDLASPVGAFVRERCILGPNLESRSTKSTPPSKIWCEENEYPKSAKTSLVAICAPPVRW